MDDFLYIVGAIVFSLMLMAVPILTTLLFSFGWYKELPMTTLLLCVLTGGVWLFSLKCILER